jgi:pimeloyl-ACP methyl ester carboxylesterase
VAFLAAVSGQACVLGHSLGGWVALVAAKFRPDLVTGLILADPPLNIARFLVEEGSAEQLHFWHGIRDQLKLAEAGTTAGLTDPDVILYHAEGRLDEYVEEVDIDRILAALRCPTLILQADPACGGKITDDEAVRAQRLLHNGSYSRFPGFGHDLGLTDLDSAPPITAAVTRFLGTIGP